MRCRYLVESPEAYIVSDGGRRSTTIVHLCEWPDQHPDRLLNAPNWIFDKIGLGLMVEPDNECVGCRAFTAQRDAPNKRGR